MPASIQSNRPDHCLLSRQSVASAGADLEQSSGECSRNWPTVQSICGSVVGQEQSLVREAAAIEKLTGQAEMFLAIYEGLVDFWHGPTLIQSNSD